MNQNDVSDQALEDLVVRRLGWAGVEFIAPGASLLIDPLLNENLWGVSIGHLLVPIAREVPSRHVLVTHLHSDHFDPVALEAVLGEQGRVVCSESVASTVASRGYAVRSSRLFEPQRLGPFSVVPVPAVDGFGIDQVSWIVRLGDRRFIHCGDTLWHGHWWDIGHQYGPFEAAFLPVNGFRFQGREPDVEVPSSMTPEQAVWAARVLGAARLVPIHYGLKAPFYSEEPDVEGRLREEAVTAGVEVTFLGPGQTLGE